MSIRDLLYGSLAIGAVILGWYYNLQYMQQPGAGWLDWIRQCMVNPAAASGLMDLSFTYAIVDIWIVLEARRLSMRHGWVFVPISVFVSLAFALGAFLIVRERRLRTAVPGVTTA